MAEERQNKYLLQKKHFCSSPAMLDLRDFSKNGSNIVFDLFLHVATKVLSNDK